MTIRTTIFRILQQAGDPISLAEIGKKVATSRQAVSYQLQQLVEKGLVLKSGYKYELQPFLQDASIMGDLLHFFTERLEDSCISVPKTCPNEVQQIIHDGIALFCESFLAEVTDILPASK
jgi:biotin operon repressor